MGTMRSLVQFKLGSKIIMENRHDAEFVWLHTCYSGIMITWHMVIGMMYLVFMLSNPK
uniref:Uncharacterized protein n=1 Tax=Rhizophora mucronata TaxID=61149 RepID=A0A2P2PAL9_RHIMU